jgi:hypothetical protein
MKQSKQCWSVAQKLFFSGLLLLILDIVLSWVVLFNTYGVAGDIENLQDKTVGNYLIMSQVLVYAKYVAIVSIVIGCALYIVSKIQKAPGTGED